VHRSTLETAIPRATRLKINSASRRIAGTRKICSNRSFPAVVIAARKNAATCARNLWAFGQRADGDHVRRYGRALCEETTCYFPREMRGEAEPVRNPMPRKRISPGREKRRETSCNYCSRETPGCLIEITVSTSARIIIAVTPEVLRRRRRNTLRGCCCCCLLLLLLQSAEISPAVPELRKLI